MPSKGQTKRRRPITVILVDHRPLTRALIAKHLAEAGFAIPAELSDAPAALVACATKPNPDILLMRSDLPGYSPFAAARNLRLQDNPTKVAIIFPTIIDQQLDEAIHSKVDALFSHEDTPDELAKGLRELHEQGSHRAPSIHHRLIGLDLNRGASAKHTSPLSMLSERERDILRLIAEGMTQRQIAERVGLAAKTVDNHAGRMMAKLGLHNRVLLTRYAIREGIVHAADPTPSPPTVAVRSSRPRVADDPDHQGTNRTRSSGDGRTNR